MTDSFRNLQRNLGVLGAGSLGQVALSRPLARELSLGRRYSLFNGVSGLDALVGGSRRDAMLSARCGNSRVGNARNSDRPQVALILGRLLDRVSPAAIARSIRPVRVEAVNRMPGRRAFAHVPKERNERSAPFFTHVNAASAIFGKVLGARVLATMLHAQPDLVGKAFTASLVSMLKATVRISHVKWIANRRTEGNPL